MKNAVFWDIKTQLVTHRKHITSPLQRPAGKCNTRFEVFKPVTMKNAVFWDIKTSSYFRGNTFLLRYRAQPINAM
jgi:hypothetical protein